MGVQVYDKQVTITEQRPWLAAVIVASALLLAASIILWMMGSKPDVENTSVPKIGPHEQQRMIEVSPNPITTQPEQPYPSGEPQQQAVPREGDQLPAQPLSPKPANP